MGCKMVIFLVRSALDMRKNVIRVPIVAFNLSAANMAPVVSFH